LPEQLYGPIEIDFVRKVVEHAIEGSMRVRDVLLDEAIDAFWPIASLFLLGN